MNNHTHSSITHVVEGTGAGNSNSLNNGSQNPRSHYVFNSFEDIITYFKEKNGGSYYERKHGLKPRCYHGVMQSDDFGTITYVTDDGRVALIWAFRLGGRPDAGWFFLYPSSEQFDYFYKKAPEHIAAVLTNNRKEHKL